MVDRVAKNNIPGQKLLVDYGFTYEDDSEPDIVLVKLTKEDFIKLSI